MKKNTKFIICALIVFSLTSIAFVPPVRVVIASSLDSDTLRERLLEFVDMWQLTNDRPQGEYMEDVIEFARDVKKHSTSSMAIDFTYEDTFNFTNYIVLT